MCEHEKSTRLRLVRSQAYHTRLITVTASEKKNHTEDMPELGDVILTRTETMGGPEMERVG